MAIAYAAGAKANQVNAASTTYSLTCSGSDRFLLVGVQVYTSDNLSSVTYAGVSMTQVDKQQIPGNRWMYLYYLTNPTTGANNVVATMTGATFIASAGACYSGVDQTTPINVQTKNTGTSVTSLTTTATTTVNDCWMVLAHANNWGDPTAGTNTTKRESADATITMFDSNAARSSGSNSLQVTGSSGNYSNIMVGIAPAAGGATVNSNFFHFM